MQASKTHPHRPIDNGIVVNLLSQRFSPFDMVELHPKPGPASVFGGSPCAATALLARSRANGQPLAKQDHKGASHAREVCGANHDVSLLIGFKLVCERCQIAHIYVV